MSRIDDLEKIQELKEKGILTEEEFKLEKQKILASPTESESNNSEESEEPINKNDVNKENRSIDKKDKKKIIYLVIGIVLILIIAISISMALKNNKTKETSQNMELSNNTETTVTEENNDMQVENNTNNENPIATMEVKDYGTIKIELYYKDAPNTVKNFIALANNGFYDNLKFHRIIKDFVVQGGDKNGDGTGNASLSAINNEIKQGSSEDKEYTIKGEFSKNGVTNNIKFEKGTIAMARADYSGISASIAQEGYNSASSQFFISTSDSVNQSSLDGEYAAFGKVIEGFDVLDKLNNVKVSSDESTPVDPPVITNIRVNTNNKQYELPNTQDVFDIEEYIMGLY